MLTDLLFEGIIKGLETVSDVLEYGPVEAVRINTSVIPQAERDYRRITANINKQSNTPITGKLKELMEMTGAGMIDCHKALTETNGDMGAAVEFLRKNGLAKAEKKAGRIAAEENTDDNRKKADNKLEKFSALIENIKANFPMESDYIDLGLIYDYHRLNAYGKVILDKINPNKGSCSVDLSTEEKLKMGFLFKEKCRKGECNKYSFIFWALMVLTADDTDKEKHLSQICDFGRFLEIDEEEMKNITRLICTICKKK